MTPRFLGNLFWHAIADLTHGYLRGATQKARSHDLWRRFIQPFYEETGVQTRLSAFGLTTVKQDNEHATCKPGVGVRESGPVLGLKLRK